MLRVNSGISEHGYATCPADPGKHPFVYPVSRSVILSVAPKPQRAFGNGQQIIIDVFHVIIKNKPRTDAMLIVSLPA